ncbi:MAG: hypothetical protein MUC65_07740, partial [Pontiellaceae bacterium]|nr:hypothetical protein [Pontiellaceae bacterium]
MSKNRNYKKGNVLILVMAAMLILSILGMAKLTIARIDATEAIRLKEKETAFSLAQQGFNEFKALVNDDDNLFKFQTLGLVPYNGTNTVFDETVPDPLYPGRPPGTYTVSLEHATYTNGFFQDVNGYKVTAT